MAFSENDKKVLNDLPGKTEIKEPKPPDTDHVVLTTTSSGMKHEIKANTLTDYVKGLEEKAKNFDLNKAAVEFFESLKEAEEAGAKRRHVKHEEEKAKIDAALAKEKKDLQLRAEILRAYLNAQTDVMYQKIDELKKLEGIPPDATFLSRV